MAEEKLIAIGCDDTENLSSILYTIGNTPVFHHHLITATRVSDLIGSSKSSDPDLVILCFRNNRQALNDLRSFLKKPEIPILCLLSRFESEIQYLSANSIVFTCPLEYVKNKEYFNSRINSIFLLRNTNPKPSPRHSFLTPARNQSSPSSSSRNLSRYVLELDQKVEVLQKVKNRIADLFPKVDGPTKAELISIVHSIKMSANNKDLWEDFKLFFEETDPNFLLTLARKYPFLTPIDLKYCCYLKMNMTNDDIKNIFGISLESVRTHKYRLKKKMALSKDEDLTNYLRAVG